MPPDKKRELMGTASFVHRVMVRLSETGDPLIIVTVLDSRLLDSRVLERKPATTGKEVSGRIKG
jgi:hypothetical protein